MSEQTSTEAMNAEVSIVEMDGRVAKMPANGEGITIRDLADLADELGVSATAVVWAWEKIHGLEAMRTR